MAQPLWKTTWQFLKIKKKNPTVPPLDTYPKELKAALGRAVCTPMLIESLFTVAKRWEQPSVHPRLMYRQNDKMLYIQTIKYYLAIQRKEILTWPIH
jgi:hypothetical protein